MNEIDAMNLVRGKLKGYRVKRVEETPEVYLFMCEYPDPDYVPSKLAVAVNKKNSKIGSSLYSYDEAIRFAK